MIDESVRSQILEENSAWFSITDSLSTIITSTIELLTIEALNSNSPIFPVLFFKIVDSFSSSKMLIVNGYIQDASTITRSLLESLFILKACMNDEKYIEKYILSDTHSLKYVYKQNMQYIGRILSKGASLTEHTEHYLQEFKKRLDNTDDAIGIKLNIYEAARVAKLEDMYNLYYTNLSTLASHPTPRSLSKRIKTDKNGLISELILGPTPDGASFILSILSHLMIVTLNCMSEQFALNLQDKIHATYKAYREEQGNQESPIPTM